MESETFSISILQETVIETRILEVANELDRQITDIILKKKLLDMENCETKWSYSHRQHLTVTRRRLVRFVAGRDWHVLNTPFPACPERIAPEESIAFAFKPIGAGG